MAYKALVMAVMAGLAMAAPQYVIETPKEPPSLYETPEVPTTTTTTTTTTKKPGYVIDTPAPPVMMGMPYDFQWQVEDQETSNTFNHVESSDGVTTQGEYRVLLPDGRTQVVVFFDKGNGFNADVTYE